MTEHPSSTSPRARLLAWLPDPVRGLLRLLKHRVMLSPHAQVSFSQEGEDRLLERLFEGQPRGFYVDVGAHHPSRFSNTRLLHERGWRGINIDAAPGSMTPFRRMRPHDVNLEVGVSSDGRPARLHVFDEPALNSFSEETSAAHRRSGRYEVVAEVEVATAPLRDILATHLPADVDRIDLLTVDVEGRDLDVLRSNDWDRFRPRVVLIEVLGASLEDLPQRPEPAFLRSVGYELFAKLVNSVVFRDAGTSGAPSESAGGA